MEILAKTRYLRMSNRKVRLVADAIRGMDVLPALDHLRVIVKAASKPIEKTLRSALANAEHNFQLKRERLFVKKIFVDQGPMLKRWRARAFGRAAPIAKHSCHITIVLDEKSDDVVSKEKKSSTTKGGDTKKTPRKSNKKEGV